MISIICFFTYLLLGSAYVVYKITLICECAVQMIVQNLILFKSYATIHDNEIKEIGYKSYLYLANTVIQKYALKLKKLKCTLKSL